MRHQLCLDVGKDTQKPAVSGCKEGEWGGQVPQPADKGISREVMMIQDSQGLP